MNKNVLAFVVAAVVVIGVILVAVQFVLPQWLKTAATPPTQQEVAIAKCQIPYSLAINGALPIQTAKDPQAYQTARIAAGQAGNTAGTAYANTHNKGIFGSVERYVYNAGFDFAVNRAKHTTFVAQLANLDPALLNTTYQKPLDTTHNDYLTCEGKALSPNPNQNPPVPGNTTPAVDLKAQITTSTSTPQDTLAVPASANLVTLSWTTTNTGGCTGKTSNGDPAWVGVKTPPTQNQVVNVEFASLPSTYTITCAAFTGGTIFVSDYVTLTQPAAP